MAKLFLAKFIYHLTGRPKPTADELEDELERLLFLRGPEQPNHVVEREPFDSEIINAWLRRKLEPSLVLLLLDSEDNSGQAKTELSRMKRYKSQAEKFLRPEFVHEYAMQRINELCFDNSESLRLAKVPDRVKRVLTFLSRHLENNSNVNRTLLDTEAYTAADVGLYRYLKRIMVGGYKNSGIRTHLILCEPLISFMKQYARKNLAVIDVSGGDPLASEEEVSLVADLTRPAMVALGFVLFFLWRIR